MLFCMTTDESADNGGRMFVLDMVDNRVYFMGNMAEFRYLTLDDSISTDQDAWVIVTLGGSEGTRIDLIAEIHTGTDHLDSVDRLGQDLRIDRFKVIVDMFDKFSANEHKDY